MAKVELKQPIVAAIAEDVKDAQSIILVDYRGITVEQDTELRKQLREAGIIYKVCKNTMMKRAFEGTDFAGLNPYLEGPSAVAISTNYIQSAGNKGSTCGVQWNATQVGLYPRFEQNANTTVTYIAIGY